VTEKHRILIVDDSHINLLILTDLLQYKYNVSATTNAQEALQVATGTPRPALILLDIMMPEMDGYEVCRQLKANRHTRDIPVLFITAMSETEDEVKGFALGAADYISKPFSSAIVLARVENHINLHLHQENLEHQVSKKTKQLRDGYIDTIYRLTLASEFKDEDTGAHIKRISYYTKEMALKMGMDTEFSESIFYASPMHDIGKVGIPDSILLKEGPLDEEEWVIMKTHASLGAQILKGSESPYLKMAVDIANYHHERWDGLGYPCGLKKQEIPLTARIMNITDQYDALRSKRPYKPAFDHHKSYSIICDGNGRTKPEHFDPEILHIFKKMGSIFCDIYETYQDS
jgi:cyclic di-GMP phosphodiesterase